MGTLWLLKLNPMTMHVMPCDDADVKCSTDDIECSNVGGGRKSKIVYERSHCVVGDGVGRRGGPIRIVLLWCVMILF